LYSGAQSIQGVVLDEKGEGLPFATLQLFKSDSSIQKVETTRADGTFRFINLNEDNYRLVITFIGYQSATKLVDIEKDKGVVGRISLEKNSTKIGEVTISADKPMIQVEADKTIFNVSQNLSSTGDNGVELLRKAPGLQVDSDDNIILEGKQGITVYVNGKQSYLQGQDLTNYLKSLRAEEIEKIEIITQPSSKYDAAGSAGILNIVLKREKGLGTNGTVTNSLTYGDYLRNSTTLNVNHRTKKFALFGIASHYDGTSTGFFDIKRIQNGIVLDGETDSKNSSLNDRLNVGGDYYMSDFSTLSLNINGSRNVRDAQSISNTNIFSENSTSVDSILRAPNRDDSETYNITTNVNYTYKDTSDRMFSVDLDYVYFSKEQQTSQPNFYVDPNNENITSENINFQETPIDIDVYSAKTDYEQKLWKGILGIGTKVSQVETNNTFNFFNVENGQQLLNENRSNTFDYEERIIAGYFNYKFSIKKVNLQFGLRAEHTNSDGVLTAFSPQDNKTVKRSYLNWFPSGGVSYSPNRNNSLALVYSRRIARPNYENLNPFESQINELSFRKGNPFLQPQFTENIKISNTYKYRLTTSLTYSYVSDFFAEVTEADGEKRGFIQTQNVADNQVYNFSLSYPFEIKEWWNVYISSYAYYTSFTANNPAFIPIDQFIYGGFGSSTFSLPKSFKLEVSGWYSSPSIWRGAFRTKSMGALSIAASKSYNNWTAKLSFNDVLFTSFWRAENDFAGVSISGSGGNDSRNVTLFLSYAFGQKDVKEKRRRNSGSEDEQNRL
jgi:hypothetical protein